MLVGFSRRFWLLRYFERLFLRSDITAASGTREQEPDALVAHPQPPPPPENSSSGPAPRGSDREAEALGFLKFFTIKSLKKSNDLLLKMSVYIIGINSLRFLLIHNFFCDAGANSILNNE